MNALDPVQRTPGLSSNAIQIGELAVILFVLLLGHALTQENGKPLDTAASSKDWDVSVTVDGYLIPNEDNYVNPSVAADHDWLHLEARYNYENLRTGSLWFGRNFRAGKKLVLNITPMIGSVFGRTTGIGPGIEASLAYRRVTLSISNEYVFDLKDKAGNFYYSWPELKVSATDWLKVGLVAQRTKPFETKLDVQRGFLVGLSHKQAEFTIYVFNAGWVEPTVVLEAGWTF